MQKMKLIYTLCLAILAFSAATQSTGRIVFEEKMDLHKTLPPERQDMKDMIPQFNSSLFEFVFNGDESIYQPKKAEDTEVTSSQGGATMTMRFGRDNRVVYKNIAEDKMIDSRDFMQKQFLITGPPTTRKWKVGAKQKEILGYACMEANFRLDSTTAMTAWFTPQIQVSNGPSDYQGLPGMILQIDINEGTRTITATEIVMEDVDTSVIVAPSKGKEVTSEEFEKIREEKMKEMGIQGGQGPGSGMRHMIMIRN